MPECDCCVFCDDCTHFEQQLDNSLGKCPNFIDINPDGRCFEDECIEEENSEDEDSYGG